MMVEGPAIGLSAGVAKRKPRDRGCLIQLLVIFRELGDLSLVSNIEDAARLAKGCLWLDLAYGHPARQCG